MTEQVSKKNLSLHPLKFKEAVADLLKVKPEPKAAKVQKPKASKTKTARRK